MTNIGFIEPEAGYHQALRSMTRETGALLLIDETQTLMCAFGGLTSEYGLEPDMLVVGKSIGGGVPFSAYGLNEEIANHLEATHKPYEVSGEPVDEVAVGGTTWGNALSIAAARAALEDVLTEEKFAQTLSMGGRLADGIEAVLQEAELDWSVQRLFTRAAYSMSPSPPKNAIEARAADAPGFKNTQRIFMANRGIWDFGWWGGPSLSVAHTAEDVDRYVEVFRQFLSSVERA